MYELYELYDFMSYKNDKFLKEWYKQQIKLLK